MAKGNSIHLRMGDVEMNAKETPMPETQDPTDCYCPHCRSLGNGTIVMDIVQHGFFADNTTTVFWCKLCGHFYYIRYDLEHDEFNLLDT